MSLIMSFFVNFLMKNDKNKSMARLQLSQTHGSEVILPQDRPITELSVYVLLTRLCFTIE